ncbi:acyl-CoA dehydrogenase family protein [Novosphingobium bradum]|uniref:Acyl-CoA dehydrogenase family protein n=1 Tax=Novosphingobium bradum TaxID=1737444 RepID=A0ABV7IKY6_9SPHN
MDRAGEGQLAAFRAEVRHWLETHVPRQSAPPITADARAHRAFLQGWQRTLHDGGWAGIAWPAASGGRDLDPLQQIVWYEEYARAAAPEASGLSVSQSHAGPTLIQCGTPEQQAFHLPRILRGEAIWCQGFSEPGAGSDLAGIRCRGEVVGDEIVVNGSKIWTSFAQGSDYQELVLRTEPGSQRHKGLSWVICDMSSPGITVRPIRSMDGEYHNCEVFYDNVRIPLANVVGALGDGWRVSMATLAFERGRSFVGSQVRIGQTVERLIAHARDTRDAEGRPLIADAQVAARLGALRARSAGLKAMTLFAAGRSLNDEVPGAEGTYVALMLAEVKQELFQLWMDLLELRGLEVDDSAHAVNPVLQYLFSYAVTIGGGTSEVRRNIIAERLLGLPRHEATGALLA